MSNTTIRIDHELLWSIQKVNETLFLTLKKKKSNYHFIFEMKSFLLLNKSGDGMGEGGF